MNDYAESYREQPAPDRERIIPYRWASRGNGCPTCLGHGWLMWRNPATGVESCSKCHDCNNRRGTNGA